MKTYKDLYKFPLKMDYEWTTWVYDQNDNFVFQFEFYNDEVAAQNLLNAINGKKSLRNKELSFVLDKGQIISNEGVEAILIRGWGGLTSPNRHGLSIKEAANVQDTFAEYLLEQLNKRDV